MALQKIFSKEAFVFLVILKCQEKTKNKVINKIKDFNNATNHFAKNILRELDIYFILSINILFQL